MANHTEIIADMALPIGQYEVNEGGQKKKKTRHRNVGVLMRTTWDGGGESLSVRLNAEVLNQSILTLLARAGVLPAGEDSVLCRIYERERKGGANKAEGADAADPVEVGDREPGPF
jgi:hypothetical protein